MRPAFCYRFMNVRIYELVLLSNTEGRTKDEGLKSVTS